jgi:antitoxin VapB
MATTKLFQSNRSQAVRIPKAIEFPPDVRDVAIRRVGRTRIITPANSSWDDFFDAPGVDLGARHQPEAQTREPM